MLDLLVKVELVSGGQAQEVLTASQASGMPVDVQAAEMGFLTEEQLVNVLTQECWVPHLKVEKYEIRKKALDTITEKDARYFGVLPIDKLGSILNLAMVNPLDAEAIHTLGERTGLDIKKVVSARSEIEAGIDRYYGNAEAAKAGGLDIAQDRESARVTSMLAQANAMAESVVPAADEAIETVPVADIEKLPTDLAGIGEETSDPFGEVEDIDDLLAGGESVQPVTLDAGEIEPDLPEPSVSALEPVAESAPAELSLDELDDVEPVAAAAPVIEDASAVPDDLSFADEPAAPAPTNEPAAPAVAETAEVMELQAVSEENFQSAITSGKQRVFAKWVSLQTRNRILNAVPVDQDLHSVLGDVWQDGVDVPADKAASNGPALFVTGMWY